ncbi:MAG: electron transfer flavoprotein subunit alpha/FixB family protein [Acidimicrobiales bacterium]|nr:electron transfer flavoprotein subunit alpha/FixB family protein [Acidimicrobiales bacterium]RZV47969.1 MAG: electron transfer flavoprotein subunit alpha/FixB family protein [Acidimicrobiales bacterium]
MMVASIWVYGEVVDGALSTMTTEMLAKARELSSDVSVVIGGDASDAIATEAGAHGASGIQATGDLGAGLQGVHVGAAIAAAIEAGTGPAVVMAGTTYDGRDVAARLSVALDAPVITNVVNVEAQGDQLVGTEPVFGGTSMVKTAFTGDKAQILLVRPKSFVAEETGGGAAAVNALAVPDTGAAGAAQVVDRFVEESDGPKLDEAAIVVSGGRGLGDAEKFGMVEELASLLGGAAGASRAIVDAGWVPYSSQVGQTGKVVKPDVYIALGISGATQHLVGMKGSKTIIAVNKDEEAPIFGVADLGIVGDVHNVVPKLIEALKSR